MLRLLCFLFFLPGIRINAQQDWELKKSENGINVYSKSSDTSRIKPIKVICELDGTLSQLTKLLLDAKAHEEWVFNTNISYVVNQVSPNEQIYYSEIKFPWPLANRDVVAHMTLNQDPASKVLTVKVVAIEGELAKKEGIVRIPSSTVTWKVKPVSAEKLAVEYVAHADPGGSIPVWLVNSFSTKGPIETFGRLKKLLKSEKYKKGDLAFIVD